MSSRWSGERGIVISDARRRDAIAALRPYVERAQRFSGWSFDDVRMTALDPAPPWDYEALARARIRDGTWVLDVGTGGGEVLARIIDGAAAGARVVAMETWDVNLAVAQERLATLGVRVFGADSERLPFADGSLDVFLSRHEAFTPSDVARALRPGGVAITQQVGASSWDELRVFFPRKTRFPDHYVTYRREFESAGLVVESQIHERRVAFPELGDVVYLLLTAPWEIEGFDPVAEIDALLAFDDAHRGEQGIVMTETRYLMVAS